jgi:hypothetical protein
MDFLKRVLNAQLAVVLLAGTAATFLRVQDLVPAEVWKDVVNTCLMVFVGGGLLKEGLSAFAQKGQP